MTLLVIVSVIVLSSMFGYYAACVGDCLVYHYNYVYSYLNTPCSDFNTNRGFKNIIVIPLDLLCFLIPT